MWIAHPNRGVGEGDAAGRINLEGPPRILRTVIRNQYLHDYLSSRRTLRIMTVSSTLGNLNIDCRLISRTQDRPRPDLQMHGSATMQRSFCPHGRCFRTSVPSASSDCSGNCCFGTLLSICPALEKLQLLCGQNHEMLRMIAR